MHLVLLHALPLDGSVWANEMQLEVESTIAPTLYGLGQSLESWARGVLDLAGRSDLVLVGNSVGGSCALEVARLAPDRVAAVVLVGAKAGHRPEPSARDSAIRDLTEGGMPGAWPKYWEPLFGSRASPAALETARGIAFAQPVADLLCGVRVFHGRSDRTDFIRSWPKALVFVSGDEDRTPSPTTTAVEAASAPKGEFHLIEGTGHYIGLERPFRLEAIVRQVLRGL